MNADGWGLWPEEQGNQANQGALGDFLELNNLIQQEEALFDLNVPVADIDDLGDIVDLIQGANANGQVNQEQPAQVIDASDQSSDSEGNAGVVAALPDLNAPVEVEVFIPMEGNANLQIMPDELGENDLLQMDVDVALQGNNNDIVLQNNASEQQQDIVMQEEEPFIGPAPPPKQQEDYIQLGFVQLVQSETNPVFAGFKQTAAAETQLPAEMYRAWAQFFSPAPGTPQIAIPSEWATFWTAALLNPGSFTWAKNFLTSAAWPLFKTDGPQVLPFALPSKCPVTRPISCLSGSGSIGVTAVETLAEQFEEDPTPVTPEHTPLPGQATSPTGSESQPQERLISPSTGPWSMALLAEAGKLKLCEDDPNLRRSCRKRAQLNGFKGSCLDRKCIACSAEPPTLSPSLIRNLGSDFCKIESSKLTDAELLKKKKAAAPGARKPATRIKPKVSDGQDKDKHKDKAVKKKAKKL
ncbi:unnamed protein product [Urochloa humidicola]